jgi:hypothetical protein
MMVHGMYGNSGSLGVTRQKGKDIPTPKRVGVGWESNTPTSLPERWE